MTITVCSVVFNDQKTDLFGYMVESVLRFTQDPKFIIADNGGNNLSKYHNLPEFNIISNKSILKGSLQHGDSLNKIVKKSTTEYTAIIESDVVVLRDDWWKTKQNLKAAIKLDNLYHVCFLVGKTDILKKIDWRPNGNVSRSFKPNEDVGFRLSGVSDTEKIFFVDCKSPKAKIFKNLQSDEFHDQLGNVVAGHYGRGSNIPGKASRPKYGTHEEQLKKWKETADRCII